MEADDRGGRDIGKAKKGFTDRLAHVSIHRYRRKCLPALCQSSLVVFRDVDPGFAEESAYPANDTRNVVVREDQQRISRLNIDVKRTNSREPRECAGLCRTRDRDLLHSTAQPDFYGVWIVLR